MIRISINIDKAGVIKSITAEGHAPVQGGAFNAVCMAVSLLLKTCINTINGSATVSADGSAESEGLLCYKINHYEKTDVDRLKGLTEALCKGLGYIKAEFSGAMELTVE